MLVSNDGQTGLKTQNHVGGMHRNPLGYRYQGKWEIRESAGSFEVELLAAYPFSRGFDDTLISRAILCLATDEFNSTATRLRVDHMENFGSALAGFPV